MEKVRELEKRYRKKFKKGNPVDVFFAAVRALTEAGEGIVDSLRLAAKWMREHGRPVRPTEVQRLVHSLKGHGPDLSVLYLLCSLARHSPKLTGNPPPELLALLVGFYVEAVPEEHPSVWFLLAATARALERYPASPGCRWARANIGMKLASMQLQSGDATLRQTGLLYMESHVEEFRELAELGQMGAASSLAQGLHNLGMAWLTAAEQTRDSEARSKGIMYLRQCSDMPERQKEPRAAELTLRCLGIGLREQAEATSDVDEARALLDDAEVVLDKAVSVVHRHSPETVESPVAAKQALSNVRLTRTIRLKQAARITEDEARSRMRADASWGIRVLGSVPADRLPIQSRNALRNYRKLLAQESDASAGGFEELRVVCKRWRGRRDAFLDVVEASSVADLLEPSVLTALAPEELGMLEAMLAATTPRNLSLLVVRELAYRESHALHEMATPGGTLAAAADYWRRRTAALLRLAADPLASGPEKRALAAWVRQMTLVLLVASAKSATAPEELLSKTDLAGAVAFRTDLAFFGQGRVVHTGEVWPDDVDSARTSAYRDRASMDMCAAAATHLDIVNAAPELLSDTLAVALDERWLQQLAAADPLAHIVDVADGTAVPDAPASPRQEIERGRLGLANVMRAFPEALKTCSEVRTSTAYLESGVARFLRESPQCAILTAVSRRKCAVACWREDAVRLFELGPSPESEDNANIEEALAAFTDALMPTIGAPPDPNSEPDWMALAPQIREMHSGEMPTSWSSVIAGLLPIADKRLSELLHCLAPIAEALAGLVSSLGLEELIILERDLAAHVPWEALPVALPNGRTVTLGSVLPMTRAHTLEALPKRDVPTLTETYNYAACAPDATSPLQLGRAVFGPKTRFHPGVGGRYEVESGLGSAAVARFFAHGVFHLFPSEVSGLVLDEAVPNPLWQVIELRALDLRACSRVELWACETTFSADFEGLFFGHEEPTGVAPALLLSGAGCVLGSRWKTPAFSAALIADALQRILPGPATPAATARALAAAVEHYRQLVAEGGVVEQALRSSVDATAPSAGSRAADLGALLLRAFQAARRENALRLGGPDPEEVPEGLADHLGVMQFLGPVAGDELVRFRQKELDAAVAETLDWLRGPLAWAGWRIYVAGLRGDDDAGS